MFFFQLLLFSASFSFIANLKQQEYNNSSRVTTLEFDKRPGTVILNKWILTNLVGQFNRFS